MKQNIFFISFLSPVSAFVQPTFLHSRSTHGRLRNGDEFKHHHHAILLSSTTAQQSIFDTIEHTEAMESAQLFLSSQNFEEEIFKDLAHVILDFATLFSPDTLLLRLLILMGRAFNILSDVIPDQYMTADEIVVQSCMFALSTRSVVKMLLPWFQSIEQTVSFQDGRIFSSIFRPAGFSWQQYKFLLSNKSLEWIEVAAESTLCLSQQNLVLTYKGAIFKTDPAGKDSAVYRREDGRCANVFVGDLSLFKDLLDFKIGKKKSLDNSDSSLSSFQILQTANSRAVVLRINTATLLDSVKHDSSIAEATKNMIFNAIQDRLKTYDSSSTETNRTDTYDSGSTQTNRTDARLSNQIDDFMLV